MNRRAIRTIALLTAVMMILGIAPSALAAGLPFPFSLFGNEMQLQAKGLVKKVRFTKSAASVKLTPERSGSYDLSRYARVSPASADDPTLTWSSSNEAVARVDANGRVSYFGEGVAKITATANDASKKKAIFKLTVKAVRVSKLTISDTRVTKDVGDKLILNYTVSPKNASYPEVRFTSSNEAVATVSASGVVSMRSSGVAVITASTDNPTKPKNKTCTVQVRSAKPSRFKISAVGDVIIGGDERRGTQDTFNKYLDQYGKETGNPYTGMLINAAKYFRDDDVTLANLECAITNNSINSSENGTYVFRARPKNTQILSSSSIEVVSLANNHTDDFFGDGYSETKKNLRTYGVKYCGHGYKEKLIQEVNGLRVGFLGFQTGSRGRATTYQIRRDVKKLKKEVDLVIVSIHFCDVPEYTFQVKGVQKTHAHAAVNAGADLVLGHHPHVLSGMESYKGVTIAYGLGSFLSVGSNPSRARRTFILQQTFDVHEGFTEVKEVRVIPFWISTTNKTNTMRPMYAPGDEAQKIKDMIDKYSVGTPVNYTFVGPDEL